MGPRLTVSGQMVERSTVGAAGLSRNTTTMANVNTTAATPAHTAYWRIFFRFKSGRAISIARSRSIWRSKGLRTMRVEKKDVSLNRAKRNALEVPVSGAALFDSGQCKPERQPGKLPKLTRLSFPGSEHLKTDFDHLASIIP
jgi:hypothetical protein